MNLIDDREALVGRLRQLSPDAQARWGRMNVNQMLCHCADGLRGALGELEGKKDESSALSRSLLKWLVLYVIPIPKEVPTSKRVDQVDGDGTRPTDFESDRATLIDLIGRVAGAPEGFGWSWHFKFGPLDRKEWSLLSGKHIDHHLKQFGA
jgi:hypothetical protein